MKNKKIEINIPNKIFYSFLFLIFVIVMGVEVYAYNQPPPTYVGHTLNELMPSCTGWLRGTANTANSWGCTSVPPACEGGTKVLHYSGGVWSCYTVDQGFECNWVGWNPSIPEYPNPSVSPCYIEDTYQNEADFSVNLCPYWDGGMQMIPPGEWSVYTGMVEQEYCSGGSITDVRYAGVCPAEGDTVCHWSTILPY